METVKETAVRVLKTKKSSKDAKRLASSVLQQCAAAERLMRTSEESGFKLRWAYVEGECNKLNFCLNTTKSALRLIDQNIDSWSKDRLLATALDALKDVEGR